jgi:hypothetical protein
MWYVWISRTRLALNNTTTSSSDGTTGTINTITSNPWKSCTLNKSRALLIKCRQASKSSYAYFGYLGCGGNSECEFGAAFMLLGQLSNSAVGLEQKSNWHVYEEILGKKGNQSNFGYVDIKCHYDYSCIIYYPSRVEMLARAWWALSTKSYPPPGTKVKIAEIWYETAIILLAMLLLPSPAA